MGIVRMVFSPFRWTLGKMFTWGNQRPRRLCYAVGLYTFFHPIYDMSYASIVHNFREPLDLKNRYGSGSWVVVSGASNPVGKQFALKFAKKGFNVILVDQSEEGMAEVKTLLDKETNVKVQSIYHNFPKSDEWKEYEELCQSIQEAAGGSENISILVNNVEEKDTKGAKFHKAEDAEIVQTINMNTFPLVFTTRFLGPGLKNRVSNGKKSAIINISSTYADRPEASLPIYSSAKSFGDVFSQNLWYENQEMDILTVKGMPVKGKKVPNGVDAADLVDGAL